MKHDANMAKSVADMSDDEFGDWLCALPAPPGLSSTDEAFAASIERARADVQAGRVYPHAIVGEWLRSMGNADRKPLKEWLAERHD